ncbi:MAG: 3-dehydroquinate synthase [Lachnospiraceae bacterium]|nr:3-dehydroquinate synthase [Lachnospiraceae bacterium]
MQKNVHIGSTVTGDAYDIIIENNFESIIPELEKLGSHDRRVLIISDTNVAPVYLEELSRTLESSFKSVYSLVLPAGESYKNLDQVRLVLSRLLELEFDRKDFLAALGGGVIGDLTGFAAAIYRRGIRFIQIPTTLLSQTDSSIGGKTGVDLDSYKNMVGAFHQPSLTYINVDTLNSLSPREFSAGMGEIIKHGLIKDSDYLDFVISNKDEILAHQSDILARMIERSLQIKAQVVEEDPKELGIRAILNFGHTIGHAIEKWMNFSLLHGECVSLGSIAAAYISLKRGFLKPEEYDKIHNVFSAFSLPVSLIGHLGGIAENKAIEEIVRLTKSDKKMDGGKVRFILLQGIGNAVIDKSIRDEEIEEAIKKGILS